ncbi:hypothetical protein ASPZODRAFT_128816 [Penicilliopsis zonata CBS 506.65]|uniref:Uncharacterized protein n=1 Tax=Penicilliopsis zonata CBS 506.65 TaxID=1073090 RepID=A0A1L9SSU1_9EURO|nr:hypothetical protein ASPZODRAFT_128816 [Penicilliopsis zonata CBS 506.65]OJJ50196.1 hypothetical protein ASPZODRAFT_128816 [Penicilliopsis zonata CBS 506.65]
MASSSNSELRILNISRESIYLSSHISLAAKRALSGTVSILLLIAKGRSSQCHRCRNDGMQEARRQI